MAFSLSPTVGRRWWASVAILFLSIVVSLRLMMFWPTMQFSCTTPPFTLLSLLVPAATSAVDLRWHAPAQTDLNNLTKVLNGDGTYGFIYNSSTTLDEKYGTYNWCNMPHVRKTEYVKPTEEYQLRYVELIQRHHKRTPYAANSFPVEPYHWDCGNQGLFYFGQRLPVGSGKGGSAQTYWDGYISDINPFVPSGWIGSCQFPQITADGLDDSFVHGADLYDVYHDLLGLIPGKDDDWRSKVQYRVTNNQITGQVAGMLITGMWGTTSSVPLLIQAAGVDSLEPQYSCSAGSALFSRIKSSGNAAWVEHLAEATDLYATLDDISGVPPDDSGFHESFDHYYDNLSARQCHAKPLPCKLVNGVNSTTCVTQGLADTVYRLGQWEYSQMYRDASSSLAASVSNYGVWIAELSAHIRAVMKGDMQKAYWHNVAHDGSLSRVLSILQLDEMVWPGMGSEVVFEVYEKKGIDTSKNTGTGFYIRVLFGGQTLKSSNPSLGLIDMLPAETLLAYFDGLVGENASLIKGKCNGTVSL